MVAGIEGYDHRAQIARCYKGRHCPRLSRRLIVATRLQVKKLVAEARLPERGHPTDAGLDVFSAVDCTIRPGEIVRVSTGIAVHPIGVPGDPGYGETWTLACLVWDKSGMGSKGLKVMGGVIDDPYRGELMVVLANVRTHGILEALVRCVGNWADLGRLFGDGTIRIVKGQKLANLIVQRVELPSIEEVEELGSTARGAGGFGSTGN